MNRKARVIAFYLPQFHPIPENDAWWGKGFTEWTNVGKAKPLYRGHYQPKVPADLGYYDLRLPEVREAQAKLAHDAGIEGFCYWHYWFNSKKQLLDRPFKEVLTTGKPDFPFCLGWANHSWTNKSWEIGNRKVPEQTLLEMIYNEDEYEKHFMDVLPAFKDNRYIKVDGKPLFLVWRPLDIPNPKKFVAIWNDLARKNGLKGVFFVGIHYSMKYDEWNWINLLFQNAPDKTVEHYQQILDANFDAVNSRGYFRAEYKTRSVLNVFYRGISKRIFRGEPLLRRDQKKINNHLYVKEDCWENVFPTLMPNWDRSPRSGRKAMIYYNSTPEVFREQIKKALELLTNKSEEHKILFLQSWNEWAEGNYVEPDLKYGHGFLNVLKDCILSENDEVLPLK